MQPIYFSKAGKLMLNKFVDGAPVKSSSTSFFRSGAVQSVTPNITINGSPISDGNSLWPAANPDTSIEGTIAVQLGFMPSELYAFIMGDTSEVLSNVSFPVIDEEIVVPSESPYEITLNHLPVDGTILMVDVTNTAVAAAATAAEASKYFQNATNKDKLEFVADDAGKSLFVSYSYTATSATKFGLPKTPVRPAYQLIVVGEAVGEDETMYEVALTVDKCKVLGSINPPSQGGTPNPCTITFTVQKPRGDLRAVEYLTTEIA
jgi:hypothetical protein